MSDNKSIMGDDAIYCLFMVGMFLLIWYVGSGMTFHG